MRFMETHGDLWGSVDMHGVMSLHNKPTWRSIKIMEIRRLRRYFFEVNMWRLSGDSVGLRGSPWVSIESPRSISMEPSQVFMDSTWSLGFDGDPMEIDRGYSRGFRGSS